MARRKSRTLTELELEIMHVIWRLGEASVPDIHDAFRDAGTPLALPSVRTMLSILQDKGYVSRRHEGRGHLYRALVPRADAETRILKDIVDRAFRGSAANLVAALVGARMVSGREIDKVKELVRKIEGGRK